jgi:hypothetical protein
MMRKKTVISHIKAGFGNQIFQFATGYAAAKRMGAIFKLDITFFDTSNEFTFKLNNLNIDLNIADKHEIEKLKNKEAAPLFYRVLGKLGLYNKFRKKTHIDEKFGFSPDDKILNLNHSAYIFGWCTAIRYFHDCKKDFQVLFSPKLAFTKQANYFLEKIKQTNSVSMHVRRGDYVDLESFFRVLPISYFEAASEIILKKHPNANFFIFSNDLNWARENFKFLKNVEFVDLNYSNDYTGKADIEEFFLMKHCKHNVIANSSFSWWPAYLNSNPNKIVITPKVWFNNINYQKSFEANPLMDENWISI